MTNASLSGLPLIGVTFKLLETSCQLPEATSQAQDAETRGCFLHIPEVCARRMVESGSCRGADGLHITRNSMCAASLSAG